MERDDRGLLRSLFRFEEKKDGFPSRRNISSKFLSRSSWNDSSVGGCVCVCVLGGWGVVFDLMEGYLYGEVLNNHQPEVDSFFFFGLLTF